MNLTIAINLKASANNIVEFAHNKIQTTYENFVITKDALRHGLSKTLEPLYTRLKYAVTLTMKRAAIIAHKNAQYKHKAYLTESVAKDQLKYFIKRLTHYAYGADAKRKSTRDNCIPIVVPSLEGDRSFIDRDKRMHWHLAIGNLPDMTFAEAGALISKAWKDCDFAYQQIFIREIYNVDGWIKYMTKGLLFGDTGVIEFDCLSYPKSFEFNEIKYLQINESSSALELR